MILLLFRSVGLGELLRPFLDDYASRPPYRP